MEDLLVYIACISVGFGLGYLFREVVAVHKVKRYMAQLEELQNQVVESDDEKIIRITIERHSDVYYAYSKDKNEFMGQGLTLAELEDNLASRYPNTRFGASEANLKEIGLYDTI